MTFRVTYDADTDCNVRVFHDFDEAKNRVLQT